MTSIPYYVFLSFSHTQQPPSLLHILEHSLFSSCGKHSILLANESTLSKTAKMTVFIVTLNLPNTVGFHTESTAPSTSNGSCSPEKEANHGQHDLPVKNPSTNFHGRSHSLHSLPSHKQLRFSRPPPVLAVTPGATTKISDVFLPNDSLTVSLNATKHSGMTRNKSSASLHSLAAMEPQNSIWGHGTHVAQPKSLARSPPPQSILDDTASLKGIGLLQSNKSQEVPRRKKKEIEYTVNNYTIQPSTISNAGLHAAIRAVSSQGRDLDEVWIGSLGMPTDALSRDVKHHIANKLEDDYESLVVFINDTDMNSHYENYCKFILWPMFHSQVPDMPKSKAYQDNSWSHYVNVNKAFCDCIIKNYKPGDILWVHDYHLLLVPDIVRKQIPHAKIGLYIHSAFPPSEIFRCLPSRYELIEGMLGANMIAFQTEDYRYQFLQTCSRLLNIEAAEHGLVLENGRFIDVFVTSMGIDVASMNERRELPEVKNRMQDLTEKFAGKHLVVARDKLDSIHGLKQKLRGFADFLLRYPEWVGKVILVQIATSVSRDRDLVDDINKIIMTINNDYGDIHYQPIIFLNQDIDYSQYLALLSIADCMLVTSLSEGMNLTCHEFVVCQDGTASLKGYAPLVVSEFVGAASVFGNNALLVNPWHPKGIAESLNRALRMGPDERKARWEAMYEQTSKQGAIQWYNTYMEKLEHAWKEHSARDPSMLPRLKMKGLRQKYDQSVNRLFLIDLEGTLTEWGSPIESVVTIPRQTIDFLTDLVSDEKNTVYVMSHHGQSALEHMFRDIVGFKLGLIAENGAFIRKPGQKAWALPVHFELGSWKGGVMDMLRHYESSVPGSLVQELKSGIVLHYYDAEDAQDAHNKAGEIANQINEMCFGQGVTATPIEKGLLITPSTINKAMAARSIQAEMFKVRSADFVLVIGDSNEDECVFTWARELPDHVAIEKDRITTCVVGRRSSTASFAIASGNNGVVLKLEKLMVSGGVKDA